jgi:hypothetical protein
MKPTIYNHSIYTGAGIYKAGAEGGGGNLQIKESILDMADDWEDVSDQFELTNSFTLKELDQTNINVQDAGICYSKKLSVIYIPKDRQIFLCSPSNIARDNKWYGSLSLKQDSRFENAVITNYVFPSDVNRGMTLHQMYHLQSPNISTTDWLGIVYYIGPGNLNGISIKTMMSGNSITPRAVDISGICLYVDEK